MLLIRRRCLNAMYYFLALRKVASRPSWISYSTSLYSCNQKTHSTLEAKISVFWMQILAWIGRLNSPCRSGLDRLVPLNVMKSINLLMASFLFSITRVKGVWTKCKNGLKSIRRIWMYQCWSLETKCLEREIKVRLKS